MSGNVFGLPDDIVSQPRFDEALRLALAMLSHENRGMMLGVKTWADAEVTRPS